jgi:phage-related protein
MTAPLFVPPRTPSQRTTSERQPRVIKTSFGDGYAQRSADGVNADLMKITLYWTGLTNEQAGGIENFMAGLKGCLPFRYTLPWETTQRVWVGVKWNRSFDKPTALFSVDIEEVPA